MEQLLKILENNARLPVEDIATMLNKSPAEVAAMMDLARAQGIIKGYKTLVDWEKAKVNRVEAVIELNVSPKKSRGFDEIAATIAAFDEVESVLLMSGGYDLQLVIKGQTNGTYYKAISLNFTEPWLGGRKPNSLTIGLYYSDETNAYYFTQKGTKHFRTIGVSAGIGRRLSWPDRYFTLYNEISYQAYNLKDWDNFLVQNGTSNIIQFKTVFGRNSVDQPIYPRQGSDFSISLSLTPPYSLFDGKNYADPNMSNEDRYRWIEFNKWLLKGKWYYPLSANRKLVLMTGVEFGYLGSYNKNKPSPFEGFDVGGDGMTGYNVYGVDIIKVRGYENGGLTPYSTNSNTYARVYNKYTVEVRYPFIMQPSSTIYGLVFAEGGNGFATWKDFDPFSIKRSVGVGIRLYLPIVGMLGFDWGYGFDNQVGSSKRHGGELHFMMGQEF